MATTGQRVYTDEFLLKIPDPDRQQSSSKPTLTKNAKVKSDDSVQENSGRENRDRENIDRENRDRENRDRENRDRENIDRENKDHENKDRNSIDKREPSRTNATKRGSQEATNKLRAEKSAESKPKRNSSDQRWFQPIETKAVGKINANEVQLAFEIFQNKHFSLGTCKFVVRIFDLDKNGGLDVREFEQLYFYVKHWVYAFNTYDTSRSGFLNEREFAAALKMMDVNFSPEFVKYLISKTNPNSDKISLDQFIITCIQIQRFTNEFKARDSNTTGSISLKYEDFLEMILKCVS